jgi:hypothetical protein
VNRRIQRLTWSVRSSDVNMLLHLNGRERTEDDWKKLFAAADTRLEVEFEYWENSAHCLIKALWTR